MNRIILSAITYALTVFAIGFLFGGVRVLLISPHTGNFIAVLIEIPVMILVSFLFARWIIRWQQVPETLNARLAMGILAFCLLMAFEILVSFTLFDATLPHLFWMYVLPNIFLGHAAQLVLAVMPVLLLRDGHG